MDLEAVALVAADQRFKAVKDQGAPAAMVTAGIVQHEGGRRVHAGQGVIACTAGNAANVIKPPGQADFRPSKATGGTHPGESNPPGGGTGA